MRSWSLRLLRQFLDLALSALRVLAAAASVAFKSQAALHLENLALRHQLGVLRRSVKRPKLSSADRLLWTWLCEVWSDWRSALVIVKPQTVIAWHRDAEWRKHSIDFRETSGGIYILRKRKPPSQTWRTFLENHVKTMVSIDFFTVPTLRFQSRRPFSSRLPNPLGLTSSRT